MQLTKSDILLIDELIETRKKALDVESRSIVDHCMRFKNNQDCNKTLIKNAIKVLRAEKKISAYKNKINSSVKNENKVTETERKQKNREKFLIGSGMQAIFYNKIFLKLLAISEITNEKDRKFLLENVEHDTDFDENIGKIEIYSATINDEYHQLTINDEYELLADHEVNVKKIYRYTRFKNKKILEEKELIL